MMKNWIRNRINVDMKTPLTGNDKWDQRNYYNNSILKHITQEKSTLKCDKRNSDYICRIPNESFFELILSNLVGIKDFVIEIAGKIYFEKILPEGTTQITFETCRFKMYNTFL